MAGQIGAGKRLLVLGGGISGLSFIHYLRNFLRYHNKMGMISKITLVEANEYMGGSVKSNVFDDGVVHELGPRSIRVIGGKGGNTVALLEQLGLGDRIMPVPKTSAAQKRRFVYKDGAMHQVPASITHLFKKLPGSRTRLITVVRRDLSTPKLDLNQYPDQDPSLYDFVAHRFGEDAANCVLDPLVRGITAGDARKTSTRAIMSDLIDREQIHGSIFKSMFKRMPSKTDQDDLLQRDLTDSETLQKFQKESVLTYGLKTGLQSLPEHLCNSLLNTNDDNLIAIYNKTKAISLHLNNRNLEDSPCSVDVQTVDGDRVTLDADHVISTIPASQLTELIPDSMPKEQRTALKNITQIKHAPVACVCVEYRDIKDKLPDITRSFGYLAHSQSDSKLLGIAFDSSSFPAIDERVGSFRMTCMMGGAWFENVFGTRDPGKVTDAQLEQIALREIEERLGLSVDPHRISPYVWNTGIAQYEPGHVRRLEEARNSIKLLGLPITLLGQSYDGVAINDVIYSARQTANKFVESL